MVNTALVTMRILVQFIGQIGAVMRLRQLKPDTERPFRMWLYPLPALLALCGWIFVFLTSEKKAIGSSLVAIVIGALAFLVWSKTRGSWPFASEQKG